MMLQAHEYDFCNQRALPRNRTGYASMEFLRNALMKILHKWSERFGLWWRAPITGKDQSVGAFIGAVAGFWVGFLLLVGFGAFSSAAHASAWWALFLVLPGALFGYRFPKVATVFLFPFASIGGGG
jgi:hypothetical protein